jgi:hypothetical protein
MSRNRRPMSCCRDRAVSASTDLGGRESEESSLMISMFLNAARFYKPNTNRRKNTVSAHGTPQTAMGSIFFPEDWNRGRANAL